MPRNRVGKIGYVKFWLRRFNLGSRPFFHQKTAKIGQKVIVLFLKNSHKIGPRFCDFWIARWRIFVLKSYLISSISASFMEQNGVKVGQKLKKKRKFWGRPISVKVGFSKTFWNGVLLSLSYNWCKFQQNRILFGGVRAQKR